MVKKDYLFKNFLPKSINEEIRSKNQNKDRMCMYILLLIMVMLIPTVAASINCKKNKHYSVYEEKNINSNEEKYQNTEDINKWLSLFNGENNGEISNIETCVYVENKDSLINICKDSRFNIKDIEKIEGEVYLITLTKNENET